MTAPTEEQLSAIPLLASLSPKELETAARLFTVRSYPKHAIVANEGDRLERFSIILSGKVQAFWRDEGGHELRLGIDGPGEHFADTTLGGEPAMVSHIAITDLCVACIRMVDLEQLIQRHPQVALILLTDVVARLRRIVQRTKTLAMEDVYGRVVKLLLASSVDADGKRVTERVTHAEIGHRVGATREMVGRVLRELANGGYIKAEAGRITVLRKPPSRDSARRK